MYRLRKDRIQQMQASKISSSRRDARARGMIWCYHKATTSFPLLSWRGQMSNHSTQLKRTGCHCTNASPMLQSPLTSTGTIHIDNGAAFISMDDIGYFQESAPGIAPAQLPGKLAPVHPVRLRFILVPPDGNAHVTMHTKLRGVCTSRARISMPAWWPLIERS